MALEKLESFDFYEEGVYLGDLVEEMKKFQKRALWDLEYMISGSRPKIRGECLGWSTEKIR